MNVLTRFGLVVALCATLLGSAFSQTKEQINAQRSDAIQLKMRQNALLIQLTPLLLEKDQLNRLLSELERIGEKQKKIYAAEAATLASLEADLDKSINGAIEKGAYPPKETQAKINKAVRDAQLVRGLESGKMVDDLLVLCKKAFNEGQLKCMRGSFDGDFIDPINKGKNLKDDDKLAFFIRFIFLDPLTYDLVARMYKSK